MSKVLCNTFSIDRKLKGIAQGLANMGKLNIVFNSRVPKTDGDTIYLPMLSNNMTTRQFNTIVSHLQHEVGHILYSDFTEDYKVKLLSKVQKIKNKCTLTLVNYLVNWLEDIRIETLLCSKLQGLPYYLLESYKTILPELLNDNKTDQKNERYESGLNSALCYYYLTHNKEVKQVLKNSQLFIEYQKNKYYRTFVTKLKPIIDSLIINANDIKSIEIAIIKIISMLEDTVINTESKKHNNNNNNNNTTKNTTNNNTNSNNSDTNDTSGTKKLNSIARDIKNYVVSKSEKNNKITDLKIPTIMDTLKINNIIDNSIIGSRYTYKALPYTCGKEVGNLKSNHITEYIIQQAKRKTKNFKKVFINNLLSLKNKIKKRNQISGSLDIRNIHKYLYNNNTKIFKTNKKRVMENTTVHISADISYSTNPLIKYIRETVIGLDNVLKSSNISFSISLFNSNYYLLKPINKKLTIKELKLITPNGGTDLSDAIIKSSHYLESLPEPRKILIIVTDGEVDKYVKKTHNIISSYGIEIYYIVINKNAYDTIKNRYIPKDKIAYFYGDFTNKFMNTFKILLTKGKVG